MKKHFSCPICKKEVARHAQDFPFCSERCRLIDLGNWADGNYAIAAEPVSQNDREEGDKRLH